MSPNEARAAVNLLGTQLQHEWMTTVKVLAAVPEDKKDYRPDEKSRTAWELVRHIADTDVWFMDGIIKGAFIPGEGGAPATTVADVVEWYKKSYPAKLEQMLALPDHRFAEVLDFFGMKNPAAVYVVFTLTHMVHHRGQLATYLRPMGAKVPSIYGGSADEAFQG